jgi:polyferredoxin
MGKQTIWLRRAAQALFLGLWIFLFWQTAHQDVTPLEPDLFLTTNPLIAILTMVTARVWVTAMIGGLVLIILTLLFGRFFCGWVCPLGTLLDIFGRLWIGPKEKYLTNDKAWRRLKYYLLVVFALVALIGGQLIFLADPLVLSYRAVAMGVIPSAPGELVFLPLLLLFVIVALTGVTHRFWCRYLCPLGAFYGAVSRFSLVRRRVKGCDGCKALDARACQEVCPMHASVIKQQRPEECIRCMSCETVCEKHAVSFGRTTPLPSRREDLLTLDRRTFVLSAGMGTVAGIGILNARNGEGKDIVRPPMVKDDALFLGLCVRCGQCIRACPTGTLQPLFLEVGFAGLWSPAITPRVEGCKDDCNACAEACPTGAIPEFGPSRKEKWSMKMGSVTFESHRCITYSPDAVKPCLKCVAVCPNRAIVIDREADPIRPLKVVYEQCIGCGRCETACRKMVIGEPAMTLNAHGVGNPALLVVDPTPPNEVKAVSTPEEAG